jgi:uncharacterized repeat protein (TIGR02543 family)
VETLYTAGSSYRVTGNITLFAKWNAIPQDTITFSANSATSGTAPGPMTATRGTNITLPGQGNLLRDGYTFGGWNTASNGGGTDYAVGASYMVNGPGTLYAKWNPITYTVRFEANGGTGDMANQSFTYGISQNLNTNIFAPPTNQTFAGWAISEGGPVDYTDGASAINLTTTQGEIVPLYAQWTSTGTPPTPTNTVGGTITLSGGNTERITEVLVQLFKFDIDTKKLEPVGPPVKPDTAGKYSVSGVTTDALYFIIASLDGYSTAAESVLPPYPATVDLTLNLGVGGASQSIILQQLLLQLKK